MAGNLLIIEKNDLCDAVRKANEIWILFGMMVAAQQAVMWD